MAKTTKDELVPAPNKAEKKSDSDIELDGLMSEIESDLREEELKKIWRRHGSLIIGVVVAVVLGVVGVQLYRHYEVKSRAEIALRYDQAIGDLEAGKFDEAITGFKDVAGRRFADGFKVLAELNHAAALLKKNDQAGAVALYTAVAADSSIDPLYRDLATLLRVLHTMDSGDPKALEAALAPIAKQDNPYFTSATELTAMLAAKQGDRARAHKLFEQIIADLGAPAGVRQRATDLAAFYKEAPAPQAAASVPQPVKPESVKPIPAAPAALPPKP